MACSGLSFLNPVHPVHPVNSCRNGSCANSRNTCHSAANASLRGRFPTERSGARMEMTGHEHMEHNENRSKDYGLGEENSRKKAQRGQPQPKKLNHGFRGFHGFGIPHPRRPPNGIGTEANKGNKENSSFLSFVPFCSEEIRVIRAIRGKIFSEMNDSRLLSHKRPSAASRNRIRNYPQMDADRTNGF